MRTEHANHEAAPVWIHQDAEVPVSVLAMRVMVPGPSLWVAWQAVVGAPSDVLLRVDGGLVDALAHSVSASLPLLGASCAVGWTRIDVHPGHIYDVSLEVAPKGSDVPVGSRTLYVTDADPGSVKPGELTAAHRPPVRWLLRSDGAVIPQNPDGTFTDNVSELVADLNANVDKGETIHGPIWRRMVDEAFSDGWDAACAYGGIANMSSARSIKADEYTTEKRRG